MCTKMSSSRTGIFISLKCSISWEYLSISYTLQCIPCHLPKQLTIVACQWSLADFWFLWRIVEMLCIFIYWLPHKLAQPVYTRSMPHGVNKVISQPLCTFFFHGCQWRSVLSIHAYMLKYVTSPLLCKLLWSPELPTWLISVPWYHLFLFPRLGWS